MAEICKDVNVKIFGPANATDFNENNESIIDQNKNIKPSQLGPGQEVERLLMSSLINW